VLFTFAREAAGASGTRHSLRPSIAKEGMKGKPPCGFRSGIAKPCPKTMPRRHAQMLGPEAMTRSHAAGLARCLTFESLEHARRIGGAIQPAAFRASTGKMGALFRKMDWTQKNSSGAARVEIPAR